MTEKSLTQMVDELRTEIYRNQCIQTIRLNKVELLKLLEIAEKQEVVTVRSYAAGIGSVIKSIAADGVETDVTDYGSW